jgi:hypothetical protein
MSVFGVLPMVTEATNPRRLSSLATKNWAALARKDLSRSVGSGIIIL